MTEFLLFQLSCLKSQMPNCTLPG